jgi:hypothetical protein
VTIQKGKPTPRTGPASFHASRNQLLEVVVLDGGWIEEPTNENVLFAFEPSVVMAAMHTTTIRASITAYSTAVGPSSFFTNLTSAWLNFYMGVRPGWRGFGWAGRSRRISFNGRRMSRLRLQST